MFHFDMFTRQISTRFRFLSSISSSVTRLGSADVDFIKNPEPEYLDAFMESHGKYRPVFKAGDVNLWKESFGDDYSLKLVCLGGEKTVIVSGHIAHFKPVDARDNRPFSFIGLGWVDENYRKFGAAKLFQKMVMDDVQHQEKTNILTYTNQASRKMWHMLINLPDNDEVGSRSAEAGYMSHYNSEDVFIPDHLDIDGIRVEDARTVPKRDIIEYDQSIHPYHREKYIIAHLRDADGFGKVAYDESGKVVGMGQAIIYPKGDCNIGPMYADDSRVAQAIFAEILRDIKESGKKVSRFEVRSGQLCSGSFKWIAPFLKVKPSRIHWCNLVYRHRLPNGFNFAKVFCPTHPQLFVV